MLFINQRDYPDMLYPTLLDTPEHPKSGKKTATSASLRTKSITFV